MMELDIQYNLLVKDIMQFMIELIICSILITYGINHNFARTRIDSYDSLPMKNDLLFML